MSRRGDVLRRKTLRAWRRLWRRVPHVRAVALVCALVLLGTIGLPLAQEFIAMKHYSLNGPTRALLQTPRPELVNNLKFDAESKHFSFGKEAAQQRSDSQNKHTGVEGFYSYDVDATTGSVSITDTNLQLTAAITPSLKTVDAKLVDGHMVLPTTGSGHQLIYTPETGGVKEDFILDKAAGDKFSLHYTLKLSSGTEARLLPDGSLGIFSADPRLLGNVSTSNDSDRALLEKARAKAEKTNLVFKVPAPTIVQTGKGQHNATATFRLKGNDLTVTASGLAKLHYPISIDPSISLASTSDFSTINNDDNTDMTGTNQVKRDVTNGGTLGSWASQSPTGSLTARSGFASSFYNGRLYVAGGVGNTNNGLTSVQYLTISSSGTVGAWSTATASLPNARSYVAGAIYNGYFYVIAGGGTGVNCSTSCSDVTYARINDTTGDITSWSTASNLISTHRYQAGATAYNGYLYVAGGLSVGTGTLQDVQRARIRGNGDLDAWTTESASLPAAIRQNTLVAYNNALYSVGGQNSSNVLQTSVNYIGINSDGSLGSASSPAWVATSSFSTARGFASVAVAGGYLYVSGGCSAFGTGGGCTTFRSDTQYAPVFANGSLGSFNTTTSLTSARSAMGLVAAYGYLFGVGGCTLGNTSNSNCQDTVPNNGAQSDVQRAQPNTVGTSIVNGSTSGLTALTTAVYGAATTIYGSTVYVAGGCSSNTVPCPVANILDTIQYATISATGTISSWTTSGSVLKGNGAGCVGRVNSGAAAYNGTLYIVGGKAVNNTGTCTGTAVMNDVQYIPLTSLSTGGAPGTSTVSGNTFNVGVENPGVGVWNGFLYIAGGISSGNGVTNNYYSAITSSTGALGTFTVETAMSTGHGGAPMIIANGYMYVLGGLNASGTAVTTVEGAKLSTSGSGALSASGPGNCGSKWCTLTSMNTARSLATAEYNNGRIYVAGGLDGSSNTLSSVEIITLDNSTTASTVGTITSVSAVSSALNTARNRHGSVIMGNAIVLIGGCTANCTARTTSVEKILVNNGGLNYNQAFVSETAVPNASSKRYGSGMIVLNGYLYVIGGCTAFSTASGTLNRCTTMTSDVEYTKLNPDGSVSSWVAHSSSWDLTLARYAMTGAFAYNGNLYIAGGCTSVDASFLCNDTTHTKDILYTRPDATTGAPSAGWSTATTQLKGDDQQVVLYANNLYGYRSITAASCGSCHHIHHLSLSGVSGNISASWSSDATDSDPGTIVTANANPVVYGGYIYLLGGANSGGTGQSLVQYAPISSGVVGSWANTSQLRHQAGHPSAIAADGFMYFYAGWTYSSVTLAGGSTSTTFDEVQVAPILANGGLGSWTTNANSSGHSVDNGFSILAYEGNVYTLGGGGGGSPAPSTSNFQGTVDAIIRRTPTTAMAHVSHFSKLLDMDSEATPTSFIMHGTAGSTLSQAVTSYSCARSNAGVYSFGALTMPTITDSGLATKQTISGLNTGGTVSAGGLARYCLMSFTLDDSMSAYAFEQSANQSILSDFYMYYHPVTTQRLRGGHSFTGQVLRGNDISP